MVKEALDMFMAGEAWEKARDNWPGTLHRGMVAETAPYMVISLITSTHPLAHETCTFCPMDPYMHLCISVWPI